MLKDSFIFQNFKVFYSGCMVSAEPSGNFRNIKFTYLKKDLQDFKTSLVPKNFFYLHTALKINRRLFKLNQEHFYIPNHFTMCNLNKSLFELKAGAFQFSVFFKRVFNFFSSSLAGILGRQMRVDLPRCSVAETVFLTMPKAERFCRYFHNCVWVYG